MGCSLQNKWRYYNYWFYNRLIKSWLQENDIEMYSAHHEEKLAAAERFIRVLKNKIFKYVTSITENLYIAKLGDIVNEHNNTYLRTLKWNQLI